MNEKIGDMLIVGATGTSVQRLIDVMLARPGWTVTGLCRKPPKETSSIQYIFADLLDLASCEKAIGNSRFTHVVYAARAPHGEDGVESVSTNLEMLRNIVTVCDTSSLRHIHAVAGGKWYGMHIGPFRTPARESDPSHMPPNFYFDQQNFLISASNNKNWTWSSSRPNIISDVSLGRGRNLLSTIGVYAAICKHLGLPFDFPGKPGAYTSLLEFTDAGLLANAIYWMSTSPSAANGAFNIVNGDLLRWENIWPNLAEHFGLKMGRVRHFSLARWMADKAPVWDEIVSQGGLRFSSIDNVAAWDFADFLLCWDYDVISSMNKARKAGFEQFRDTEEMIFSQLNGYRQMKVLP